MITRTGLIPRRSWPLSTPAKFFWFFLFICFLLDLPFKHYWNAHRHLTLNPSYWLSQREYLSQISIKASHIDTCDVNNTYNTLLIIPLQLPVLQWQWTPLLASFCQTWFGQLLLPLLKLFKDCWDKAFCNWLSPVRQESGAARVCFWQRKSVFVY